MFDGVINDNIRHTRTQNFDSLSSKKNSFFISIFLPPKINLKQNFKMPQPYQPGDILWQRIANISEQLVESRVKKNSCKSFFNVRKLHP